MTAPTTVSFPEPLAARRTREAWMVEVDGVEVRLSNLDKRFWEPEGYTKADLVAYYANIAPHLLPFVLGRPLTLKRMPNGADADFFYAKQAPGHTPDWVATAPVISTDTGKRIDYLLARDAASVVWLANLGCIEFHPWHSRIDALGKPDYAFFDLDPFNVGFEVVREVALYVRTVLDQLGLDSYPRTSGATGMQVYVPIDRMHGYADVRDFVGAVCRLIHRADPRRTTMEWDIAQRSGKVFLDHTMNTEGKNIAATWSLRPERRAPVATPLRWEEVAEDVQPTDFTIETIWERLATSADLFAPVLAGGQDLRAAMTSLGLEPAGEAQAGHVLAEEVEPGDLTVYTAKRDFGRTPEPAGDDRPEASDGLPRFVIQHHLATRLHHDLRLERGGTARSWAVPKGLPEAAGLKHLAVQTEDHPLDYMTFSGEIPEGEYGAGPVRIWDDGTYEALEWKPDKVTFRLDGRRHQGTWHLFRTGEGQWLVTRRGEGPQVPDPPPLEPMLATTADQPFDDDGWLFEVKWDGVRAIVTVQRPGTGRDGATRLVSRRGNDITAAYPEVAVLWERVLARNAVLDAELVAFDSEGRPSFELLQHRMHLRDEPSIARARRRIPVSLVVFDVLAVDGEPIIDLALDERGRLLDDLLVPRKDIVRSQTVAGAGTDLYAAVQQRGLEGIVAKRRSSPYRPGRRTRDWLKIKVRRTVCGVIGGWMPGEGRYAGGLGSLLVGLYDGPSLRWIGRVGTGFDAKERARLESLLTPRAREEGPFTGEVPPGARWVAPDLVCAVEYGDVTDAHRLRAPSYKGLRPDVDPRTCTWDELV